MLGLKQVFLCFINLLLVCWLFGRYGVVVVSGQVNGRHCGYDNILQDRLKRDSSFAKRWEAYNAKAAGYKSKSVRYKSGICNAFYVIPVVVHILHQNGPENISDEQVFSQIEVLNEDFSGGSGRGAVTNIAFFLAKLDPNGNPTTGITRTFTPCTNNGDDLSSCTEEALKSVINWPADRYLNIWVVSKTPQNVLGYTPPPDSAGDNMFNQRDGVVVNYKYFGRMGTATLPYNLGHTTTHEVGHWLGLYHTFHTTYGRSCEGGSVLSCWREGDLVCDTPPTVGPNYSCKNPYPNTCIEQENDRPDDIGNYLDYSEDRCMYGFTEGQANRMRFFLDYPRRYIHSEANLRRAGYVFCSNRDSLLNFQLDLRVFPTIARDKVNINIKNIPNFTANYRVFDSLGKEILTSSVPELDITTWAAGVYIVQMAYWDRFYQAKFIKVN